MTEINTQEFLKTLLHYDPETGVFRWKANINSRARIGVKAGTINGGGYRQIAYKGKSYRGHRLAWLYMTGEAPEGEIDHIDHNRANNAWSNLRLVSTQENKQNLSMMKNNKSGITGVYWKEKSGRWRALIGGSKNRITLGDYKNLFDAVCARKSAELRLGYHRNHGV